jgi:assimilatory nitrate reductase catalytic subunit
VHIAFPAAAWGEKDGTVTNSERRISRQRPFLPLPGEAKADWWMVAEVAKRMGFQGFDYRSAANVFREHAALSAFENSGTRDFDIGSLAALTDNEFNGLAPVQWPAVAGQPKGQKRFFADGGFFTAHRKASFHAPETPSPKIPTSPEFPFRLNTGRVRDQWHTMTRSGLSPRLSAHSPEPFVEVHPGDAAAAGLEDEGFARISSCHGSCVLKVKFADGQRRGSVFAPIHWSGQTASSARIGDLIGPVTDPYSGQPESKATPVALAPVKFAFRGFALTRTHIEPAPGAWWARVAVVRGNGLLMAGHEGPLTWRDIARAMFGATGEFAEYLDEPRGIYRLAHFVDGRLEGCLFIGPAATAPGWNAVKALFEAENVAQAQRRSVLSGRSTDGLADQGPLVCACFGVGLNLIRDAVTSGAAVSVDGIGKALRAGTNCGSCIPELKRILGHERLTKAV